LIISTIVVWLIQNRLFILLHFQSNDWRKTMIEYTFYGDLLGMGSYYQLNTTIAKQKLNYFYNCSHRHLAELRRIDPTSEITLFSDSIIVTGENLFEALSRLNNLYCTLLSNDLLLRGAIVKGRLTFETRITIDENFQKNLPINDTLARAVGLEKMLKGSRLIVEKELVTSLFSHCEEWLTLGGYQQNIHKNPENSQILRKICPTPNNLHYEMLYRQSDENYSEETSRIKKSLTHIMRMSDDELKKHYSETLALIQRSEERERLLKE